MTAGLEIRVGCARGRCETVPGDNGHTEDAGDAAEDESDDTTGGEAKFGG